MSLGMVSAMHGSKRRASERSSEESRGQRESPLGEKEMREAKESSNIVSLGEAGENIRGSMFLEGRRGGSGGGGGRLSAECPVATALGNVAL